MLLPLCEAVMLHWPIEPNDTVALVTEPLSVPVPTVQTFVVLLVKVTSKLALSVALMPTDPLGKACSPGPVKVIVWPTGVTTSCA